MKCYLQLGCLLFIFSTGADAAPCARTKDSWVTTGQFDSKRFGDFILNNNNWGGTPNQEFWADSASCWGVTTSAEKGRGGIGSYPSITRGWSQNQGIFQQLSTADRNDWTTKAGLGIKVGEIKKAKLHWSFEAPSAPQTRWMALIDVYFHRTRTPSPAEFPPFTDLMINPALADQVFGDGRTTYYQAVAKRARATYVTLGGVRYLVYIDEPGENSYHQPGGHTIHLFRTPTTNEKAGPNWGSKTSTTDIKAIVDFFRQDNPRDDSGKELRDASGREITSALLPPGLFLTSINAGFEIDTGLSFMTKDFCLSLQDEPDCH